MAKENLTDIIVVLDRSGSMSSIKNDTIGGFNQFLKDQQDLPGEATLSLYQFDHEYDVVFEGVKIKDVQPLNDKTFVPRGNTRLLDSMARTIISTGERLDTLSEEEKPGKVMVVIITDGEENSSVEYHRHRDGRERIAEMVKHQEATYKWEFVYLGANQDAIAVGTSMGIKAGSSITYGATGVGTKAAFASLSKSTEKYRGVAGFAGADAFDQDDRDAQKDEIKKTK